MTDSHQPPENSADNIIATATSSPGLARYEREKLENIRRQLPEVQRQLKEAGVESVHIQYDGCGDSGQIESIEFVDRDGNPAVGAGNIRLTEDQLGNLFYDLSQTRHPYWEDGDGAFGEFVWNLLDDTLKHTHNDRFTEYHTTEQEGL
jgi:hypothetical protein